MPKKYLKFLNLLREHLFYVEDNIAVFYLSSLKKEGYSHDDLKLILESLSRDKVISRFNVRWALNFLPIPTRHEKKKKLLKGVGWTISDQLTTQQYVIEVSSRDGFFEYCKKNLSKSTFPMGRMDVSFLPSEDLSTLHPRILEKCSSLYHKREYPEAVEKGFKVVRDRLRELTGFEKGSEAFGKGHLHISGAAANNVDKDFNEGVKYLTMAIDMFRNEKSHTSDAKITNSTRAYEYLRLSSLALNLLDQAQEPKTFDLTENKNIPA
jgi:uncharacterized protein (TIGR02391 family)